MFKSKVGISLISAIAIFCAANALAQHPVSLSARTKVALSRLKSDNSPQDNIHAFIEIENADAIEALRSLGVKPECRFGNLITASIPMSALPKVMNSGIVKKISSAHTVSINNELGRSEINVNAVHQGAGLDMAYTGKGVIVGMIDVGIDVNHIAFRDSEGQSRVKCVYMPGREKSIGGRHPMIDGEELPGYEYLNKEELDTITADCTTEFHGTHTTNTAAGSYKGNPYYGMAPEADLVLCPMDDESLTDANIANCVSYIFKYAESVGKPAVINMSLSSQDGPHDGTSALCQVFEYYKNKGNICVLSAGNNGHMKIHVSKTLASDTDQLCTSLKHEYFDTQRERGFISMWSNSNKPFTAKFVIYNVPQKKIVYQTPVYITSDSEDGNIWSISGDNTEDADYNEEFAKFFKGRMVFASELWTNNKMHFYSEFLITSKKSASEAVDLVPGFAFGGDAGTTFHGWSDGVYTTLISSGISGWTSGTKESTISDLCTSNATISVGAHVERIKVPSADDPSIVHTYPFVTGDLADFSSYGPDVNGIARPEVSAPGVPIVSAINRYYKGEPNEMVLTSTIEGDKYRWAVAYGTSQSCPMVTGAIALWLQANKRLTVENIKEVISATAKVDSYVLEDDKNRWGAGKLDALAGLKYVLENFSGIDEIEATESLWHLSHDASGNVVITTPCDGNADIQVISLTGATVARHTTQACGLRASVNFGGKLSPGAYLLKVKVANRTHTFKFLAQ